MSFEPEYEGDTPNRAWVRKKCAEKKITTDFTFVILRMSDAHIRWMFREIMSSEWDWEASRWKENHD